MMKNNLMNEMKNNLKIKRKAGYRIDLIKSHCNFSRVYISCKN